VIIYAIWVIPSEERHAIRCFGKPYRVYAQSTPRFIPRLSRLKRPGTIEVKVAAFLLESARDFGCILIGAATDFFAHTRLQPWWPKPFNLP
jgi:hypothetical protein